MAEQRWDAVVLTGGTGTRLGGADKAGLELGGRTLLERSLAATAGARRVVVVGEEVPTSRPVTWAREEPRSGGPAAGLLAGIDALAALAALDALDALDADGAGPTLVAVLAVDMPQVSAATLERLLGALDEGSDGALLVDERGRRQLLCGVYRVAALRHARPADRADEHGLPVRRLLGTLQLVEVPAHSGEARDVDTWDDLRALREDDGPPAVDPPGTA